MSTMRIIYSGIWVLLITAAILGAWFGFERLKGWLRQRRRGSVTPSEFPLSAFSVIDHPAGRPADEKRDPIGEAEVYVAYGKGDEAARVLQAALRAKQIKQTDVDAFWSRHPEAAPTSAG